MPDSLAIDILLAPTIKTRKTSMNAKWKISCIAAAIASASVALLLNRQPAPTIKPQPETAVVPVAKAPAAPALPPEETIAPPVEPAKELVVQPASKAKLPPQNQAQNQTQKPPKEPLHDPDARDALALVGIDPDAEQYWLEAIYDTNLPDNEREDLMEDLNEVGFADPKNLTADDLPLIANRLQLIEDVLPNVDDFMRPHLIEAYKDLGNMYAGAAP